MAVWMVPAITAAGTIVSGLLQGILQSKQAEEDRRWQEEQLAIKRQQELQNTQMALPMQTASMQQRGLEGLAAAWGASRR